MYSVKFNRQDRLSANFFVYEALVSRTADERGISNVPDTFEHLRNLVFTANKMQEVRALLNHNSISPSSWYRNAAVNKLVGGSATSSHLSGLAVDFVCHAYGSPRAVCRQLILHKRQLQYDQLILEDLPQFTIVHIGFAPPRVTPRQQDLFTRDLRGYVTLTHEELAK